MSLAVSLATAGVALTLFSLPADAACVVAGSTVTCTGTPVLGLPNAYSSATNGLTLELAAGSQLNAPLLGTAVNLTGNNITLNNRGTIDPAFLGILGGLSSGVKIGNAAASTVSITNFSGGVIKGTTGLLSASLLNLNGLALSVQNGSGGVTTLLNNGSIGSSNIVGVSVLAADAPVVAVYGGGSVNMTNTGTITGRVAFQASGTTTGNTFTNSGTITGGVSMGANSTNRFNAIAGSSVSAGAGVGVNLGVASIDLLYAPTGLVDGGAGGNNTLALQNAIGGGTGTTGDGAISAANYVNFNNLVVQSGTWTLSGALTGITSTSLNGGALVFDNASTFGSGTIAVNGGALGAGAANLSLGNAIGVSAGGLSLIGDNNLTLNGIVSGTGGLTKTGAGTLSLNAANTFLGGTVLNGGVLSLASAAALGTGALSVTANSSLQGTVPLVLANAVQLTAALSLPGSNALTLGGVISGTGSLNRTGSGDLTLNGANTYQGGTTVGGGTLTLGNSAALGSGALNVTGVSRLATSSPMTLGNAINLGANLNFTGASNLVLEGAIGGTSGLIKNGPGSLTLNGSNTYQGSTTLSGGTLIVGSNTALGSGVLNAQNGTSLDASSAVALGNSISLTGVLTVVGSNDLALTGNIIGSGGLTKNGDATLTLSGINLQLGNTLLNDGRLILGSDQALGLGSLVAADGTTLDSSQDVTVGNSVSLAGNLNIGGPRDITLLGLVNGAGSLTKHGAGNLILNGANSYQGGTTLKAGTLTVGDATALGSGALTVSGASTLASNTALALNNAIGLGADLTVANSTALTLGGDISGTAGLIKTGAGVLTLSGDNTYEGGTALNAGGLLLTSATALGSGTLTAAGATTLDTSTALTLANALELTGSLSLIGAQNLALTGVISGAGGLVKSGTGDLTLSGNNTYQGDTLLGAGTLIVGSDSALGVGTLRTSTSTTLDASTAVVLGNALDIVGNLNIGGTADLTLDGVITGPGDLTKSGAATLTLNASNLYAGETLLTAGTLVLGNNNALGSGVLSVTGASTLSSGDSAVVVNSRIGLNANLTVDGSNDFGLSGAISGNGQLIKAGTGNLTLSGVNTYSGGTALSGGTLSVGNNAALGSGALTATGTSTLKNTQSIALMNTIVVNGDLTLDTASNLTLGGLISGTGNLIKAGAQELVVFGNNTFSGTLDIAQGMVTTLNANALGNPASVNLGSGTDLNLNGNTSIGALTGSGTTNIALGNTLSLGSTNLDSVFAGAFVGFGRLNKVGSGVLELSGVSTLGGTSQVSAGTLNVSGTLNGGGLTVTNGATLTGSGGLGGLVSIGNGGHLAGTSGTQLSLGSLVLAPNANIDVALGSPVTGATSLFKVAGTLTLDGTLNITDDGGLGNGIYRLFDYTSLVNNALSLGSLPGSVTPGELQLQTAIAGQVNLLINSPNLIVQFWDGAGVVPNGTVEGGSGTWNSSATNWTELNGGVQDIWLGQFAVFQGASGVVTVEGSQTTNALQFITDGYTLVAGTGGELTAINGNSGSFAVRVDPNVTATLDLPINGTGTLAKLDTGTLVLNGVNGYTGGTALNGGTLIVGNDSALGSGTLTAAAGTTLDSNTVVSLANDVSLLDQLRIGGSNALTLGGDISGTGGLLKAGAGTLTLNGDNTYVGPTALNAGKLVLGSDTALGAGALTAAAGTQLDTRTDLTLSNVLNLAGDLTLLGSNDLTLDGLVNGAGTLIKQGASNLTLNATNGFTGGTDLQAGTLTVGNAGALGSAALTVSGASSLVNSGALSLANDIVLNAGLSLPGNNDLTLAGVISGAGGLSHSGTGGLTLAGANTYTGGTQLGTGDLTLGTGGALGTGALSVNGTSTLTNTSAMSVANAVDVGGTLDVAGTSNLNLAGVLSGSGILNKNGLANLTLSGNNTFSGILNILSGSLSTVGNNALGNPAELNLGSGATLNLGGNTSLAELAGDGSVKVATGTGLQVGGGTFGGVLSGTGTLDKVGGDTLTLGGNNTLSGGTTVSGGSLMVDGSLASSSVTVNNGTTLGGSGSLGGAVTIANGGHLAVSSGRTLTIGSLVLGSGANLDAALGAPVVGTPSLIDVAGNLTLDGTLNVTDIGGFGAGVYHLINYQGALTDNGLLVGSVPNGVTPGALEVQTSINNQVNLVVGGANNNVLFWDGSQTLGNGAVDGGSGVWSAAGNNWTNASGTLNQSWNATFAVFQNSGATVTLDGVQTVNGMQFLGNGYTLAGDALELINGAGGTTNVRIGTGISATLDVAVNGSGTLAKVEGGALVLNGNNGYTGGTQLNGGTLVVGSDTALGSGALTAANGTTLDANKAVTLGNAAVLNGALTLGGSNDLSLTGVVSGSGSLLKNGAADLTLNGVNTYQGGTRLNAGSLTLGDNSALGNGVLTVGGNAALDGPVDLQLSNAISLAARLTLAGSNDLALSGVISGNGSLVKNGNGELLLTGANTYSGGTTLNAGSVVGNTRSLQGAILNNTALTFEQASNGSYTGNLTGSGTLVKSGSGQLLMTGTSGFTGNTTVNAGSLLVNGSLASANVQVNSGATLGGSGTYAGTVNVASGATLAAGGSATALSVGTLNLDAGSKLNVVLGQAAASTTVVKVAGDLQLDGTLNIADAGGFGSGVYQLFTYGGNLTDSGLLFGLLPGTTVPGQLTLQTAIAQQINLVVQGTAGELQFWNGGKSNADGTLGGGSGTWGPGTNWTDLNGNLSEAWDAQFGVFGGQPGTVTVAGKQSFTGLQFLTGGYQLVAGTGGSLAPVNAADGALAAVRVNAGASTQISAPLVGTGGIEKLDAGTLILSGANTYTGGTKVSGGTLVGDTTSLQGSIVDNAMLVFQQDANGRFSGVLSGTGSAIKQGNGSLLLTGNQPFSGKLAVNQGLLQVGNAANPGTVLGAQVTVGAGGALSGNGSVASLVNGGGVQPDPASGLTVSGNFTNSPGGTLSVVVGNPASSGLTVGGTANLGGTLVVLNSAPASGSAQYAVVTAGGGVNGTFTTVKLPDTPFYDTTLNYGNNQVGVTVSRNDTTLASVAVTPNQQAVAGALGSSGAPAAVLGAVMAQNRGGVQAALDSLSGEIHASTASALIEDSRYLREAVNDRMRQPGCSREDDPRQVLAPSNSQLTSQGCQDEAVGWARALGTWGDMDGNSNSARLDRNLEGFLLGVDRSLDDAWRVGVAAGYTRSDLDAKQRRSDASIDSYHLATYLSYQLEAFSARMGAAYSWHNIESKRDVTIGTYDDRLKAKYKARTAQVFGEVAYAIDAGGVALEPFAGLAYVNYDSDTAHEKGGAARLKANADQDITFSTVGLRAGKAFILANGTTLTPRGSLGWRHALGDTKPDADLRFIEGGAGFTTQGVPIARDSAVVEAGLDMSVGKAGKLGLGYSGQLSSDTRDHAVTLSFSMGF
nr:autotransporter-associated beta strand repeat-containing protein [Pseudomonas aegrilactucae]